MTEHQGISFLRQVISAPANTAIIILCGIIFFLQWNRRMDISQFAASVENVVDKKEYWRLITSVVTHGSIVHIIFNILGLWRISWIEASIGTVEYLQGTILLWTASTLGMILIQAWLYHRFNKVSLYKISTVGYSGILFGWMTFASLLHDSKTDNRIPIPMAPFISLIAAKLLIRQASFYGHLAGILAGFLLWWGSFDWISPKWLCIAMADIVLILLLSVAATTNIRIPYIWVDRQAWSGTKMREIHLSRGATDASELPV